MKMLIDNSVKCTGIAIGWLAYDLSIPSTMGFLSNLFNVLASLVIISYFLANVYRNHVLKYYDGCWWWFAKGLLISFFKKRNDDSTN